MNSRFVFTGCRCNSSPGFRPDSLSGSENIKTSVPDTHLPGLRRTLLLLILFLVMLSSCMAPISKEAYLRGFERFVKEVEQNSRKFTDKDWEWANERYSLYSVDYYEKFRQELTFDEKVKVNLLKGRYLARRGNIGQALREEFSKELEQAGKDASKYIDENLKEDLQEITRGAREIGDSAVKVMENLIEEIKKKREFSFKE